MIEVDEEVIKELQHKVERQRVIINNLIDKLWEKKVLDSKEVENIYG